MEVGRMAELTAQNVNEIDISAILNAYVYMDEQSSAYNKMKLAEIMKAMPDEVKSSKEYEAVMEAISRNPELGEFEMISQSTVDGYSDELIIACAFKDPSSDTIYVSYRGTGDGKWLDNGEGLVEESTVMQKTAANYFDTVMDGIGPKGREKNRIIVTGHSKGGNEAQYVTMASEYRDEIDNCYSIDGQGFSKKAVKKFKEELGDKYEAYLAKMYSINGENDYVHDLGIAIIPEENTYFIHMPDVESFEENHSLTLMLDGDGLNWTRDEDGYVIQGEQGPIGLYAKALSERMMAMSEEELEDCAITAMYIVELFMPYGDVSGGEYHYGTGNRKGATLEEIIGFLDNAFPLLLQALIEMGFNWLEAKIEELINAIKEYAMQKIQEWKEAYNRTFNRGYKEAMANPEIKVNTGTLRSYANRLTRVNARLVQLDRDMDALYSKAGLLDLWNLLQADRLTKYSWGLLRCVNYLNDTASDFENVERVLTAEK